MWRRYIETNRTFLSLMVSFLLIGGGNIINDAIGNQISLEAVAIIGSYYLVELAIIGIWSIGFKTYLTIRGHERELLVVQAAAGLLLGLGTCLGADGITSLFGLDESSRAVLADMLRLNVVYVPLDAICTYLFDVVRLQNKLQGYRYGLIAFYACSISFNVTMFITIHEPICVLWATMVAYGCSAGFLLHYVDLGERRWQPRRETMVAVRKYGVPLVLDMSIKRCGVVFMNTMASHLPLEVYSVYIVAYNASLEADLVDEAYGNTLFLMLPAEGVIDRRERYAIERVRLIAVRRQTCVTTVVLGFGFTWLFAAVSAGSADLGLVLVMATLTATIFLPSMFSTPYRDFLIMNGRSSAVFHGTAVGIPLYFIVPFIGVYLLDPWIGCAVMSLCVPLQGCVRLFTYGWGVRRMDREFGWDRKKCDTMAWDSEFVTD